MSDKDPVYLPIEIDENALEDSAMAIVALLRPSWPKQNIRFKRFDEGLMNILIGCFLNGKYDEDVVLIRMHGKNTYLTVDKEHEKKMMRFLSAKGFCPPIFAMLKNGLSYGFVHGETLDKDTVRDENIAKLIAKEMAKLHSIQPEIKHPKSGLFDKLDEWFQRVPESFDEPELQKRYIEKIKPKQFLIQEKDNLRQELESMNSPIVVAHNDLLLTNIVYNAKEGKIAFIDYEFSMYNYQAFDIGNHFCVYAGINDIDYGRYPDKHYQHRWIKTYLRYFKKQKHDMSPVKDREVDELYVQANKCALAAHFLWGTWALIQAKYVMDGIDYLEYARIRLDEYFKKKDEYLSLQY